MIDKSVTRKDAIHYFDLTAKLVRELERERREVILFSLGLLLGIFGNTIANIISQYVILYCIFLIMVGVVLCLLFVVGKKRLKEMNIFLKLGRKGYREWELFLREKK